MLAPGPLIIASPLVTDEACFSVPAVRALHFAKPDRALTILTPENLTSLWKTVTGVAEVISYPASASARKVAKLFGDFSQSLAWEDSPAAAAFAKKGISKRIGPAVDKLPKQLTHSPDIRESTGPIEHRVRDYLKVVEQLGAQPFESANFQTPPREELSSQLRIGVSPGSDFGPSAEWDLEKFRDLLSHFSAEFFLFEAPGRPAAARNLGDLGTLVAEENTFQELDSCHLLIASDGSVPHLAAHLGIPCVVIFGPNEPVWKRPLGQIHRIVHERVACSSCFLNKCPLDHRCLKSISVTQVLSAVNALLNP
ncbi:MAG: glycosyltransferase family 9 protein [Akkermansiaceae bacterium]